MHYKNEPRQTASVYEDRFISDSEELEDNLDSDSQDEEEMCEILSALESWNMEDKLFDTIYDHHIRIQVESEEPFDAETQALRKLEYDKTIQCLNIEDPNEEDIQRLNNLLRLKVYDAFYWLTKIHFYKQNNNKFLETTVDSRDNISLLLKFMALFYFSRSTCKFLNKSHFEDYYQMKVVILQEYTSDLNTPDSSILQSQKQKIPELMKPNPSAAINVKISYKNPIDAQFIKAFTELLDGNLLEFQNLKKLKKVFDGEKKALFQEIEKLANLAQNNGLYKTVGIRNQLNAAEKLSAISSTDSYSILITLAKSLAEQPYNKISPQPEQISQEALKACEKLLSEMKMKFSLPQQVKEISALQLKLTNKIKTPTSNSKQKKNKSQRSGKSQKPSTHPSAQSFPREARTIAQQKGNSSVGQKAKAAVVTKSGTRANSTTKVSSTTNSINSKSTNSKKELVNSSGGSLLDTILEKKCRAVRQSEKIRAADKIIASAETELAVGKKGNSAAAPSKQDKLVNSLEKKSPDEVSNDNKKAKSEKILSNSVTQNEEKPSVNLVSNDLLKNNPSAKSMQLEGNVIEYLQKVQLEGWLKELMININNHLGFQCFLVGSHAIAKINSDIFSQNFDKKDIDLCAPSPAPKENIIYFGQYRFVKNPFDSNLFTDELNNIDLRFTDNLPKIPSYRQLSSHSNEAKLLTPDSLTRDFTCNTVYITHNEESFCSQRGAKAIAEKRVETIIDPQESFKVDPVRIIRYLKMGIKGWQLTLPNFIVEACAPLLKSTVGGRQYAAMKKLFKAGNLQQALEYLMIYKVLPNVIPSMNKCGLDFLTQTFEKLGRLPNTTSPKVIFSLILLARILSDLDSELYNMDSVNENLLTKLMRELKFSEYLIQNLCEDFNACLKINAPPHRSLNGLQYKIKHVDIINSVKSEWLLMQQQRASEKQEPAKIQNYTKTPGLFFQPAQRGERTGSLAQQHDSTGLTQF